MIEGWSWGVLITQILLSAFFLCTTKNKFSGSDDEEGCMRHAIYGLVIMTIVQTVTVFSLLEGYGRTDLDFQNLLASSAQLSDFNGCGDDYMVINVDDVFGSIHSARAALSTAFYFTVLMIIAYVV